MNQILGGALVMATWLASLFFFRFWRVTHDRLFLFFCLAFSILALNWLWLAWLPALSEAHRGVFLLRLLSFVLIIIGVVDKNRRSRASARQEHR